MKSKRTYQNWLDTVNKVNKKGWQCVRGWIFKSPTNTYHDLSAADLEKLDAIERNGSFLVDSLN